MTLALHISVPRLPSCHYPPISDGDLSVVLVVESDVEKMYFGCFQDESFAEIEFKLGVKFILVPDCQLL